MVAKRNKKKTKNVKVKFLTEEHLSPTPPPPAQAVGQKFDILPPKYDIAMWALLLLFFWTEISFQLFVGWYWVLDLPIAWGRFLLGSLIMSIWLMGFHRQVVMPGIEKAHSFFLSLSEKK